MKILLAEDNEVNMEITTELLSMNGVQVTQAWNGREAMEIFRDSQPFSFDAILMDMQMPEMDGLTMLEQMKNELANSRVIFITAYDKIEYAARAIRLSAFDFLMKPVKNEDPDPVS